jgi:Uma2 family endonuclease
MPTTTPAAVTPAAYLAREEAAAQKSEYEDGAIIPMPGGTPAHNRIMQNVNVMLAVALEDLDFEVLNSENLVRTPESGHYYYPDVSVTAGEPIFDTTPWEVAVVTNPCLVVEVLSPSTGPRDRGVKFAAYKTIPGLREYLLIDSEQAQVTQWVRGDAEQWTQRDYRGLESEVELASLPVRLPLARIYRRVAFA